MIQVDLTASATVTNRSMDMQRIRIGALKRLPFKRLKCPGLEFSAVRKLEMDRKVASALLIWIWILTVAEGSFEVHSGRLHRWTCRLETDEQLEKSEGLHTVSRVPGLGKFASGGTAWTVCYPKLDEDSCRRCGDSALRLVHSALDLLDIDDKCSGEGVQLYMKGCKMRYVLSDFLTPPEVLYSAQ